MVRRRPPARTERPPNVVLIIGDDMAWTDYSFMGHPHVHTPNLDRLAAEGLTFRRGYVPSSLCSPSLASILTGLYAHQHRFTSNDPPLPTGKTARAASQRPRLPGPATGDDRLLRQGPHAPAAAGREGLRQLPVGQVVGRQLPQRRVHRRHDPRRPRPGRPARRRRPEDRPPDDAAGPRLHRRGGRATASRSSSGTHR